MRENVLITTGGSGGHVIPAMILYDHLSNYTHVTISTDKRGSMFLDKDNYLSEKELVSISKNPYIKIQSHTLNHFDLTSLSDDVLKEELTFSKNRLESLCGVLVDSVCYPKGLFNSKIVDFATNVGYLYQYSSLPGSYYKDIYPTVKRRNLVQYLSSKQLEYTLRGGGSILYFWYKLKHIKK